MDGIPEAPFPIADIYQRVHVLDSHLRHANGRRASFSCAVAAFVSPYYHLNKKLGVRCNIPLKVRNSVSTRATVPQTCEHLNHRRIPDLPFRQALAPERHSGVQTPFQGGSVQACTRQADRRHPAPLRTTSERESVHQSFAGLNRTHENAARCRPTLINLSTASLLSASESRIQSGVTSRQ